jgi:hypothetical protein
MKVIPVDGDNMTISELEELIAETGGYFDGDLFAVVVNT